MRIAVCCATARGRSVLETLLKLRPQDDFWVFSFRETASEPPFFQSIQDLSNEHSASFFEASRLDTDELASIWSEQRIDAMFVVSWRYIIPMSIAGKVRSGCFVLHDSLLPSYRGFSPTVWAIANGERETGATLFHLAKDVDSGDIIDQVAVPIDLDDYVEDVMERVTDAYVRLIEENLDVILRGEARRIPQNHSRGTYTCMRMPDDNAIDWKRPTETVYNLIRAASRPYPGAFTKFYGEKLIIWRAERIDSPLKYVGRFPGRIVEIRPNEGVVILTGDGEILITEVQREGQESQCSADVLTKLSIRLGGRE